MEHAFQPWEEDFCPFDASGLPNAQPPQPLSQHVFERAVNFARFVTDPRRLTDAGDAAPQLPYTHERVEKAVRCFTVYHSVQLSDNKIPAINKTAWEFS